MLHLKSLELSGFKSFAKKGELEFGSAITAIVGPNGSGKSNIAESFRFVLGEQSIKSLRGKRGEDLIWGGSHSLPRTNRAAVRVVFDNCERGGKRLLNVDYDEVAIERAVFRDGTNEYSINNAKVRLKDVTELLASAHVGSSGHHIISQGEADRVLSASPRERREMIEDALGLRVYQYKKEESARKLEKTEENKAQVTALRSENVPHLRFLERQVKKLEKATELRSQLLEKYHDYLARESAYIEGCRAKLKNARETPERELHDVQREVARLRSALEAKETEDNRTIALLKLEGQLKSARETSAEYSRILGRLEGEIGFEKRRIEEEKQRFMSEEDRPIPLREVRELFTALKGKLQKAHEADDLPKMRSFLSDIREQLQTFITKHKPEEGTVKTDVKELEQIESKRDETARQISSIEETIVAYEKSVVGFRTAIEKEKDKSHEKERDLFAAMARETKLRTVLQDIERGEHALATEKEEYERELREGEALLGGAVREFNIQHQMGVEADERSMQLERRRELEKMKIRLEELGGASSEEILNEYKEVKGRDDFLARELEDLEETQESLTSMLKDLDRELQERFAAGVVQVSKQFNEFFVLMFGGGSAGLTVTKEKRRSKLQKPFSHDDDAEEDGEEGGTENGLEIDVSLPKKRVQGLVMLSGGERALTSIALIFAMSQVNPPPFLILDETDAALDEANSRRYGDMIENLAKRSQLILITHNRETMSRAGILYGVTMAADGVSRLLSVKFEEAATVAR